jgi:hypothetical protein
MFLRIANSDEPDDIETCQDMAQQSLARLLTDGEQGSDFDWEPKRPSWLDMNP